MVWLLLKFVVLFSFTVDEVLRLRKMNGFSRYLVAQLEEETRTTVNVVHIWKKDDADTLYRQTCFYFGASHRKRKNTLRFFLTDRTNEDYVVFKMGMAV